MELQAPSAPRKGAPKHCSFWQLHSDRTRHILCSLCASHFCFMCDSLVCLVIGQKQTQPAALLHAILCYFVIPACCTAGRWLMDDLTQSLLLSWLQFEFFLVIHARGQYIRAAAEWVSSSHRCVEQHTVQLSYMHMGGWSFDLVMCRRRLC